ncbi:aldehyde-activating protein [Nostoc sp. 3335mG]|nr:aldehyde-activating protein [Nostoc sp. 3335mG]
MTRRTASCSCGALTAACEGEPVRVSVCHCLECQKRSGSAFAVQARFPADQVAISGEWREWMRIGDEGSHARFRFCPTCSSIVFYAVDEMPNFVIVPVGGFADPTFPQPRVTVYEGRQHPWLEIPGDGIERWD